MTRQKYFAHKLSEISARRIDEELPRPFNSRMENDLEFCLEALHRVLDGRPVRPNPWDWHQPEETHLRLASIEAKLNRLMSSSRPCQLPGDLSERFPQFLTAVSQSDMQMGTNRFREHFTKWFDKKRRCVIADPYLFNLGEGNHNDYVDGLNAIIGDERPTHRLLLQAR